MVLALPPRGRLYCYSRVAKTLVGQQKSTGARAHTSAPSTVTTTSPCRPCSLRVHGTRVHAVDNHGIIPIPVHGRERAANDDRRKSRDSRKKKKKKKKKGHARCAGRPCTYNTHITLL